MSSIPAVNTVLVKPSPLYNGVKIRINNPVVVTPDNPKNSDYSGNYNAVDIKVNNPKILPESFIYNYKNAEKIVTADMAGIAPVKVPQIPVYQNVNYINDSFAVSEPVNEMHQAEPVREKAYIPTPAPNITTPEAEKKPEENLGLNTYDNVEIIPQANVKPEIDINDVISKLSDKNFDVQAVQMEKIAYTAATEPIKAIPYIVTDVYSELLDIMQLDSAGYEKPSEQQIETRKKIILNQIYLEQALEEKQDPNTIELPYKLTKEEVAKATELSPFEQAERNKEYAILTSAFLNKIYIDETEKELGKIVPLTDLPCVSEYVQILKHEKNPDIKFAAMSALMYIQRPEYNDELKTVFEMVENDSDSIIAKDAAEAEKYLS